MDATFILALGTLISGLVGARYGATRIKLLEDSVDELQERIVSLEKDNAKLNRDNLTIRDQLEQATRNLKLQLKANVRLKLALQTMIRQAADARLIVPQMVLDALLPIKDDL